MRRVLQEFLEINMFSSVDVTKLSEDEKRRILPGLDGYKEKVSPNGEFEKAKARIFANGGYQLDEYVTESSSPVARVESVLTLAAISAYRKCPVFKVDNTKAVVCDAVQCVV
jgi:hypothetical protein